MENEINFQDQYKAFRWAVSKKWKQKNGLFKSIQSKMCSLAREYGLKENDIADELFTAYIEGEHYLKYDRSKGSLNNWVAHYVNQYLKNLIRRHAVRQSGNGSNRLDPIDERNWADVEWLDRGNEKDDPAFQPEIVFDPITPEDLLIAKEAFEFASTHYEKNELEVITGEMSLYEGAERQGIGPDAFRKRLARKTKAFQEAYRSFNTVF